MRLWFFITNAVWIIGSLKTVISIVGWFINLRAIIWSIMYIFSVDIILVFLNKWSLVSQIFIGKKTLFWMNFVPFFFHSFHISYPRVFFCRKVTLVYIAFKIIRPVKVCWIVAVSSVAWFWWHSCLQRYFKLQSQ